MALCLSPAGGRFARRAQQFPGIVAGTAIDWFLPWPREALVSGEALYDERGKWRHSAARLPYALVPLQPSRPPTRRHHLPPPTKKPNNSRVQVHRHHAHGRLQLCRGRGRRGRLSRGRGTRGRRRQQQHRASPPPPRRPRRCGARRRQGARCQRARARRAPVRRLRRSPTPARARHPSLLLGFPLRLPRALREKMGGGRKPGAGRGLWTGQDGLCQGGRGQAARRASSQDRRARRCRRRGREDAAVDRRVDCRGRARAQGSGCDRRGCVGHSREDCEAARGGGGRPCGRAARARGSLARAQLDPAKRHHGAQGAQVTPGRRQAHL